MKETGIIRRLDELGRIVIPKEMRKILHIKEGTPLEIKIEENEFIKLKKYSPIKELGYQAQVCAEVLFDEISQPVYITDLEKVIANKGTKIINKELKKNIITTMYKRLICNLESYNDTILIEEELIHKNILLSPILVEGDVLGSIIVDYQKINDKLISNLKLSTNMISKLTY